MKVRITTLDNGLRVISDEMPSLQSASLGVWVNAGSRSETEDENGIAHLLEHMAFKGTKRRSAQAIAEEIEAVGGEVNAATGVESTAYYVRVLKDDVALGVDLLGDILTESQFDAEELIREKHVIEQEIGAALDQPDDRVFDLFQEKAFPDQPLGRPILGTVQKVNGFSSDDIRTYLDTHYHGPDMVLAAAGKIDHDELVSLAGEAFSKFSGNNGPSCPAAHYEGGESRIIKDMMEAHVVLGFEGCSHQSEDFYAIQVLSGVLGGGMSSRLFQEIREKRGLCYSIYSFHWGFSDTGLMGIHAATSAGDLKELMPVMLGELMRVPQDLTENEVNRAKAQLKAGLLMSLESPTARASQIARQSLVFGMPLTLQDIIDRIEGVTTTDLRELSERIFTKSRPTLSSIGPVDGLMDCDDVSKIIGTDI
ncbi:MAG: peptidase M16 [Hyphomicrobiales bacterium]|nr:MAG: peptidase M16 [Hyphomicrobiales bacterium]